MRGIPPPGGEEGIALLLTVWLLAVLAALAGEFIFSGRVKAAAERNTRDGLQSYALALAGYRAALAALDGNLTHLALDDNGLLLLHYRDVEDGVPAERKNVALGDGTFSWRIEDEDGRVNINEANKQVITALLKACGLELGVERDTIVDSLLDWRDRNREHRLNGAEEDYYRSLDPPYSCKDAGLDIPEELLLLRGMKSRYFYGGEEDGKNWPGLRDLITVCPVTFNPNTASQTVLNLMDRSRSAQPTPVSTYYSILAAGRVRLDAPQRLVRAVVMRENQGDKNVFRLIYWNDNYVLD